MNKEQSLNDSQNSSTDTTDKFVIWLKTRIKTTEQEREEATDLNLKIGKGAKLCVYKECLNYINTHK